MSSAVEVGLWLLACLGWWFVGYRIGYARGRVRGAELIGESFAVFLHEMEEQGVVTFDHAALQAMVDARRIDGRTEDEWWRGLPGEEERP